MNIDLKEYIIKSLDTNNIQITSKPSIKLIEDYVNTLLFLIASFSAISTISIGEKKISKKIISQIKAIMNQEFNTKSDKKMKGGMSSPVFYGVTEPQYSASNQGADILTINFEDGLARPQIGGAANKIIITKLQNMIKHYNVTASKQVVNELYKIYEHYFNCMIDALKKDYKKKPISEILNKFKNKKSILK